MTGNDYVIRLLDDMRDVPAQAWDSLVDADADPSPFVRHAYLSALQDSGSATASTGWQPKHVTLWSGDRLEAACPLYLKTHSYGEYVFDWAWAQAHEQHGLPYYPKALVAVPFTPVPGARLLARHAAARQALLRALLDRVKAWGLSSLHILFAREQDLSAAQAAGMLMRHTVQFHWFNRAVDAGGAYRSFDDFLGAMQQEKRKKVRQEQRKVAEAGVRFRWSLGRDIKDSDWDFFYRCYTRTYHEHGNAPYLQRDFFHRMARDMAGHWLLFVAERGDEPMACSLIGVDEKRRVAYGRYWGALERVDCLHFDACYHQPIKWCIDHGFIRFEGGAQGEHKMARALLPVTTTSAHWLAHPSFADAVGRFLAREGLGVNHYLDHLAERNPLKHPT
jgi:uncharacterized protein